MSHIWEIKVPFFESYSKKRVQFFASHPQKKLNSSSRISEIFKENPILWVNFLENYLSSIVWVILQKKSQFFESYSKRVQFFESSKKGFKSLRHHVKEGSILWVILKKRGDNSLSHIQKGFNSLESSQKGFKSLRHHVKESSILWVIFKKEFNSLSHLKKGFSSRHHDKEGSILWVIFFFKKPKGWQFFESYFQKKKGSILWVRFGQRIWDFGSRKRLGLISRKSGLAGLWTQLLAGSPPCLTTTAGQGECRIPEGSVLEVFAKCSGCGPGDALANVGVHVPALSQICDEFGCVSKFFEHQTLLLVLCLVAAVFSRALELPCFSNWALGRRPPRKTNGRVEERGLLRACRGQREFLHVPIVHVEVWLWKRYCLESAKATEVAVRRGTSWLPSSGRWKGPTLCGRVDFGISNLALSPPFGHDGGRNRVVRTWQSERLRSEAALVLLIGGGPPGSFVCELLVTLSFGFKLWRTFSSSMLPASSGYWALLTVEVAAWKAWLSSLLRVAPGCKKLLSGSCSISSHANCVEQVLL